MADPRNGPRERRVHYIHTTSYSTQERLVGAFVLVGIAALLLMFAVSRGTIELFEDRVIFHAHLSSAPGVDVGTRVLISGVEVGDVDSIEISDDNRILVNLSVRSEFHDLVRTDSIAKISKLSVIQRADIEITAGSPGRSRLPPDSNIRTEEPLSIDEVVANVLTSLRNTEEILIHVNAVAQSVQPTDIQAVTDNLVAASENIRSLTGQLISGDGAVGTLLYDESFEGQLVSAMSSLQSTLQATEDRMNQLEPIFTGAGEITEQSKEALGRLPELLNQTSELVGAINTTMVTVNHEIQQFPDLVVRTRQLMEQMDRTLIAIQSTWPISNSVPEEGDAELIEVRPPE